MILYHSLPVSLCDSNYRKGTHKFSTEVLYYVISGQSKYTTISIVPCIRKFSNDLIFAFFAITFTLQNIAKYKICKNPLFFALRNLLYYKKLLSDTSEKKKKSFSLFCKLCDMQQIPRYMVFDLTLLTQIFRVGHSDLNC